MKLGDNLMLFIAHFKREILYHPNLLPLLHTFTSNWGRSVNIRLHLLIFMKKISELVEQGFFLNSKYGLMNGWISDESMKEWIDGWIFHIPYFDRIVILNLVMSLLLTNKHMLVILPFLKKGTDPILLSQVWTWDEWTTLNVPFMHTILVIII